MKESWSSAKASVDRKDSKSFYSGLKTIYVARQCVSNPVLSADGKTLLTDKTDILKHWKNHFESVLNSTTVIDNDTIESIAKLPVLPELSHVLTHEELLNLLKQLSSRKSPEKDSLPPEFFKFRGIKACEETA